MENSGRTSLRPQLGPTAKVGIIFSWAASVGGVGFISAQK